MVFINRGRRTGKTTALINASYVTNYPILVWDNARAEQVRKQAKELGFSDIEVFSIEEYKRVSVHRADKILIDEATNFIEAGLIELLHAEVVACTLSLPCYETNENKEGV